MDLKTRYQPKQVKVLTPDRQFCALRYSPCGKVLAAGAQDGGIRRWDAEDKPLPALTGHGGWVQALVFHADGKRLFAADSWGGLRCWPYLEQEAQPLWKCDAHDGWVRGLALSPDGTTLATCGRDGVLRLWSADSGKKLQELPNQPDEVFAVAFSPDGRFLLSGDLKGVVRQWDLATGKCVRELDARVLYRLDRLQDVGGARVLAFDKDGTTLAVAGTTPKNGGTLQGVPTVLFFDWAMGKVKHTLKVGADVDGEVHDLHFHPDGFVMAVTSGSPGTGKFFFARPGDAQPFFLTALPNCHALAVHPGGTRLAVSATNGGSNGNGRNAGEYRGNSSPVHVFEMAKG